MPDERVYASPTRGEAREVALPTLAGTAVFRSGMARPRAKDALCGRAADSLGSASEVPSFYLPHPCRISGV